MKMLGQNDDGIDMKRMRRMNYAKRSPQCINLANQKRVSLTFREIDGEEIATARVALANVCAHASNCAAKCVTELKARKTLATRMTKM